MTLNTINFHDKISAYKALMPFIKESGIFVATDASNYQLGDQVQVTLNIAELGKSFSFRGSIIWLSFEASATEEGVGVKFEGIQGMKVKKVLETYTSDVSDSQSTSTL